MFKRSIPGGSSVDKKRRVVGQAAMATVEVLESRTLLTAQPYINEFLASNKHTNKDDNGDSSDWIEIYNPNSTSFNMNGYFLTDNRSKLNQWEFPSISIAANGYLLVWASGTSATNPAKPLHTNFKLDESGEYLGLVEPDGATIVSDFAPEFPPQTTDISYGVPPGGGPDNYLIPTPNAPNKLANLVADVQFDHDRGLYTSPFNLSLSTSTAGASIRYTTDGSMPTTTSGSLYTGPITINNTTVVHAIAYEAGFTSTAVSEQSYIFPAQVLQQPQDIPGYPNPEEPINNPGSTEIDVPLNYGMDPAIVNNPTYAQAALNGLSEIPSLSIGVNPDSIFGSDGFYDTALNEDGNTVPMSFEYINPSDPQDNIGVDAGIEGHSKQKLKRSFHIKFSSKYGPSSLNDNIFDTGLLGDSGATNQFTDLILRAGNNRSWATTFYPTLTTYTEDEYVRDTQIAMTGQGTHGEFVQLYINGIYWGLYNLVERPDDGYGDAYDNSQGDDYFSISQDGVESGDDTRWNYMINTLTQEDMSVSANYSQMQKYLNVTEFADYLIGQWFDGVSDWPNNNFWAGGDTSKDQPFQFQAWDGEYMMDSSYPFSTPPNGPWVNPDFTPQATETSAPIVKLWNALKKSPDFMAMFANEVYKNTANNGPLTDANALARWTTLNNSISDAIVDESARWGDSMSSTGRPTYTKNDYWIPAVQDITNDLKGADAKFLSALRAQGYYPSINPPTMSQEGGLVPSGYQLSLSNPNSGGTIYYTTDGSDPRTSGTAQVYSSKIKITGTTTVTTAVKNGSTWSANDKETFTIDTIANLRVSELMYNPNPPADPQYTSDQYEYIEFTNVGSSTLNLNGVQIADGIQFTFGNTTLAPGAYVLVVNNSAAFQELYGTGYNIAGQYSGKLSNNTDEIQIIAPGNVILSDFTYDSTWYPSTNGVGFSLTVVDPTADQSGDALSSASAWKASGVLNGTPGYGESTLPAGSVVINELLANPSQSTPGDEIELLNTTNAAIDISGWYLSDSQTNVKKFQIPASTTLAAGGYVVFTQASDFGAAFSLSSAGGSLYLSSADSHGNLSGYGDSETFGASDVDVPFERYVNSNGDVKFVAESGATFGSANSAPAVGPVVIDEMNYDPPTGGAEYLELTNISNNAVDLSGWTFTKGITFTFAQGTTIAPGAFILLTPVSPATFEATYRVPSGTAFFQFTGALDNSGETIQLAKPQAGSATNLVVEDSVKYSPTAPWPTAAAGSGPTLAMPDPTVFGDDPAAWTASALTAGTPGLANNTTNAAPTVSAGSQQTIGFNDNGTTTATLAGSASDDTLPAANPFTTTWSKLSGPGTVQFADTTNPSTTVTFSAAGTYQLQLSASDGSKTTTSTVEIDVVDLPVVTIVATDASASEPGTNTGTYTITRSGSTSGDLTVNLAAPTGTATNGVDYDTLPASVVIPDGHASTTVTLTVIDDSIPEPTETATLSIAPGTGYVVGAPASDTIYITDDETPPPTPVVTIAATDPNASESGPDTGTFTITRSGNYTGDLTVNLATPTGTATNGVDYDTLPTSVVIPDGKASATVTVTPIDDQLMEGTETVVLTLATSPDYMVVANNSATVNIADNDAAPAVDVKISFRPASSPVPAGYLADNGLVYADRGNGYTYGFLADDSSETRDRNSKSSPDELHDAFIQTLSSTTAKYSIWEIAVPNGTYQVTILSGDPNYIDSVYKIDAEGVLVVNGTPTASNHWITGTATVTVTDGKLTISNASGAVNNKINTIEITSVGQVIPPTLPTVSINATDASADEKTKDSGTFTISRSGSDITQPLTVNYTIGGTATNGTGYTKITSSVTIPANQTSTTVTITPIDLGLTSGSQSVILTLANNAAYTIGSNNTATVNIADDDTAAAFNVKISFRPASSPLPAGYLADNGLVYGDRGNGYTYGFQADDSSETRDRNSKSSPDELHDAFIQTLSSTTAKYSIWEIAVPNGTYQVTILSGDPNYIDSVYKIDAEGVLVVNGTPTASNHWITGTATVTVTDGKLTISNASGAVNNKINSIQITSVGQVIPPTLPTVSIAATDASASESKSDPGTFTITRSTGDVTQPLTVNYTITGTATNGTDYKSITSSVTIPANQTSATVTITPIDRGIIGGSKTVILTLANSANYTLGSAKSDTVIIADNDVAQTKFSAHINFQASTSATPSGYVADIGLAYGSRGNGLTYGWNASNTANTRDRGTAAAPDSRYDTDTQMQTLGNFSWSIAVPNGTYQVHLVAGDASYFNSVYKLDLDGALALSGTPTSSKRWIEATVTVTVTNGKLTVTNASGASNNKIDYIDIQQM